MYSFRVFAACRDRTGARDHPPHIQPHPPRTMVDGGPWAGPPLGNLPGSRSGWYWYPCRRDVGQGIPAAHRAFRPTSIPLPNCGTAEGVPTSRAAPGELTRRQARGKTTLAREVSPDRNPGLSAHIKPSARAHQAEGAGYISPPAASAAVGLPGCRRAWAGPTRPAPFDPMARTAFTPLPAPEFERCRFARPPQDPPSIMQT